MTPKAEAILEDIKTEALAYYDREVLKILEDGEALTALGITDDDQEAVKELHAIYVEACK